MNTHVTRPALRCAAAMAALWLTFLLIALGLLLLGCGGPTPTPTPTKGPGTATPTPPPTKEPGTATPAVTPTKGPGTATPTPPPTKGPGTATPAATPTSGPSAPCDASTISVLAARGEKGNTNLPFEQIAQDFADQAATALPGAVVYGPDKFQQGLAARESFETQMDQYVIGFYTGHGDPDEISVTPNSGPPTAVPVTSLIPLGHCDNGTGGQLRYLILSSCQTFAHGPLDCTGSTAPAYGCPGEWDFNKTNGKDTEDMRSIYERWGPRLGNGLRMICGASTDLVPTHTVNMWDNYANGHGMGPADAILAALSNYDYVSLCLAKGGYEFAQSPLMADTTFTTTSNTYGHDYYHIQYAKPLTSTTMHGVLRGQAQELIEEAAFVRDISKSFPTCLPVMKFTESRPKSGTSAKQETSLSAYPNEAEALRKILGEISYINTAISPTVLGKLGIDDNIYTALKPQYASVLYMMLAVFPVNPATQGQELRVTVKNVIITFPQWFPLQGLRQQDLEKLLDFYQAITAKYKDPWAAPVENKQPLVRLLSGSLQVQLNVDQSPISGVNSWQQPIGEVLGAEPVRTPYTAFLYSLCQLYNVTIGDKTPEDILKSLPEKRPYRLEYWTWGYAPKKLGTDPEPRLRIRYEFRFAPKAGYDAYTYPPVDVAVDGQVGKPEACPKQ